MSKHVSGLGGTFFRANDPESLSAWYHEHFGIPPAGGMPWQQEAGYTVFAPFAKDTDYFGGSQAFMFNFRIKDLKAFLAELAEAGIEEVKPQESMDGVGQFAWIQDPEGNRIELWQPA